MSDLISMPQLSFDMTEGTLARWLKQVGDPVKKGDILFEVETDKTTVEVQSFAKGVVRGLFVPAGTTIPVNAMLGIIGTADEPLDLAGLEQQAKAALGLGSAPSAAAAPAAPAAATSTIEPAAAPSGPLRISPVARNMAKANQLDVQQIQGSGPQGRIIKRDVQAALQTGSAAAAQPAAVPAQPAAAQPAAVPAQPAAAPASDSADTVVVPLSRMRQTISRRLVESKTTIPHFQVSSDVEMSAALALRQQLNAVLADEGIKLSVNDFILKATALALRQFPNMNASFQGDKIIQYKQIHVGVAVSLPSGLVTVVVRNTDQKSLSQISVETKAMAGRAREGKQQPGDMGGSTFTTSNLGMYDVDQFTAIINPPEAAILAIGSVRETPVVKDGAVVPGQMMRLTISADHRVTDGAEVAQYLQLVKKLLQNPLRLGV
jgi:pyruvate dehydrogenase E2 component (dihydrolipoamide acetyltransferase)